MSTTIEEFSVVEPRERVALGGLEDLPILRQLDDALHTGLDDLGMIEGLRYEVDGAEPQAFHLSLVVGGHDDDRDVPHRGILPHDTQHIQPVDLGHHKIEQDQREGLAAGGDKTERLLSVGSVEDLVLILQHVAQHKAAGVFVVYDQNQSLSVSGMKLFMTVRHAVRPL